MRPVRKLKRIRGQARIEKVRRGTGSEHIGIILETLDGKQRILVRKGGNPFNDPETHKLLGRTIEVEGYCVGTELRYTSIKDVK